ncbi:hypothetical protein BDV93DRAFT_541073 [Ceratobasidium sp. AG-I]|nr:hypothetical protein BDV93DRAFT_541073 [Ceratobasidium sp. AG-I]
MPKRPHSPALDSVLSVKHAHTARTDRPRLPTISNFDSILSDETALTIFTFLDPYHLCLAQEVNRHWNRLATDNHLWKTMFFREYPRQRLRGSRGFSTAGSREIKPLPSRAQHNGDTFAEDSLPENYTDWRWMYRISSNWSKGRCAVVVQRVGHPRAESLIGHSTVDSLSQPAIVLPVSPIPGHLLLAGDLIIYASSQPTPQPTVYVFRGSIASSLLIPYQPPINVDVYITALSLDHSSANIRLAIFYSDSTWSIRTVDYEHRTNTLVYHHPRPNTGLPSAPVIQAAYHHPLLVTLTLSFRMSIFYVPPAPAIPTLKHTLFSYSGFLPLTMTLSRYRTPDQYRILLAHASPIYPSHWSPSATDIMLSTQLPSLPPHSTPSASSNHAIVKVTSSASTNNSLPEGWIPDGTPDSIPEELRLRWSRKVSHVSGIETDGKFVVFASEDGGIQVYRLHRNARLLYERTLFPPAHAPSPRALSVADSRCVCATRDGDLWVWDLESGVGVQAASIRSEGETDRPPSIVRIAFDAHRVVAVDADGAIRTYDFDI